MSFSGYPDLSSSTSTSSTDQANPTGSYNPAINQFVADNANKFFGGSLSGQNQPYSTPNYQNQLLPNNPAGGWAQPTPYEPHGKSTHLPIGQVMIVPLKDPVPFGWRVLTYQEGQTYKSQLATILDTWSIVAFDQGKLDGKGYGNSLSPSYGKECGERFIVRQGWSVT